MVVPYLLLYGSCNMNLHYFSAAWQRGHNDGILHSNEKCKGVKPYYKRAWTSFTFVVSIDIIQTISEVK